MIKRTIALLTAASMLTLTACAKPAPTATTDAPKSEAPKSEAPQSEAPKTAETSGSVTLKIPVWDVVTPFFGTLKEEFEKQNPDIKIEYMDIPSADYTDKLSIMLNGNAEADTFFIKDADTTFSLYQKGQLADLTEFVKQENIDMNLYNGLAKNFEFDGKQIGMPFRTDYYILYYNKDIFDAANEPYPSNDMTWEQFEATAKKITSGEGATKNYGGLIHTWQACVQNWSVANGKNTIMATDYSFFKPYYEMVLRMQNEDKSIMDFATMKTGNIHYSSPFLTGNVGMMPMGTWFMSTLISKKNAGETNVNWGVATIPHASDISAGYTVGAATPMVINNASKNKEAAWKFVKFATGEEGASILAKAGQLPGRVNPQLLETIAAIPGMPEGLANALTVKNISLDRPIVDKVREVNKMLEEEHGLIMLGEATIDEGLKAMGERSKEIQGK